jgi:hypothetical protein
MSQFPDWAGLNIMLNCNIHHFVVPLLNHFATLFVSYDLSILPFYAFIAALEKYLKIMVGLPTNQPVDQSVSR